MGIARLREEKVDVMTWRYYMDCGECRMSRTLDTDDRTEAGRMVDDHNRAKCHAVR